MCGRMCGRRCSGIDGGQKMNIVGAKILLFLIRGYQIIRIRKDGLSVRQGKLVDYKTSRLSAIITAIQFINNLPLLLLSCILLKSFPDFINKYSLCVAGTTTAMKYFIIGIGNDSNFYAEICHTFTIFANQIK